MIFLKFTIFERKWFRKWFKGFDWKVIYDNIDHIWVDCMAILKGADTITRLLLRPNRNLTWNTYVWPRLTRIKHSTAASLPPFGPGKSKLSDNVLVWLPAQPQIKQRKTTNGLPNELLNSEYAFSTNNNDAPQPHPPHATVTHRDPEITKIIKKPNRHFRLYVVSFQHYLYI